jgi:hypothetical protein
VEPGICKNLELKTKYYIISRTMIGDRCHGQQDDNLLRYFISINCSCSNTNSTYGCQPTEHIINYLYYSIKSIMCVTPRYHALARVRFRPRSWSLRLPPLPRTPPTSGCPPLPRGPVVVEHTSPCTWPLWKSPRGRWIGKSEIYKLKAQLQAGLALELKSSPKERAKTNQPKK